MDEDIKKTEDHWNWLKAYMEPEDALTLFLDADQRSVTEWIRRYLGNQLFSGHNFPTECGDLVVASLLRPEVETDGNKYTIRVRAGHHISIDENTSQGLQAGTVVSFSIVPLASNRVEVTTTCKKEPLGLRMWFCNLLLDTAQRWPEATDSIRAYVTPVVSNAGEKPRHALESVWLEANRVWARLVDFVTAADHAPQRGAPRIEERIDADEKWQKVQDYLARYERTGNKELAAEWVGHPRRTLERWRERLEPIYAGKKDN